MADTDEKAKPARPPKGEKAEQGGPKQQQAKGKDKDKGQDKAAPKGEAAAKPKGKRPAQKITPRLRTHFEDVVRKQLTEQRGYKNRMQVPTIQKVVINMGIGEGVNDRKKVDSAAADLGLI